MQAYSKIVIAFALVTSACASSQGEQVRDARMEQAEVRADAREKATEDKQDTRDDAVAQTADDARDRNDATNVPDEDAREQIIDVGEERAAYQSQAKARLDKLGVRIDEAQQKLSALGSQASTSLKGELATTTIQHKALKEDLMELDETPPTRWEATTDQLDDRMAQLDDRVSDLADEID